MKALIGPWLAGGLFAIGLGISGMTEPRNIIGFLDVFGDWRPQLILVMVGAISVYAITYRLILRCRAPIFGGSFSLPTTNAVDVKLIFGAALFGVGWALTGLCPGPGLVGLVSFHPAAVVFVVTMTGGLLLSRVLAKLFA